MLRLCPSSINWILTERARPDSIIAGVPAHGRVRRRRTVSWSDVVD